MALILTEEDLDDLVARYSKVDAFAFDVETIGPHSLEPLIAPVIWLSLAADGMSDVIPMGHPNGDLIRERLKPNKKGEDRMARGVKYEDLNPKYDLLKQVEREFSEPPDQLPRGMVFEALEPLFFGPATKVGHNIRYDLHAVAKYYDGRYPTGDYFDTMIGFWINDSSLKRISLADCWKQVTGRTLEKGVGKSIGFHSFRDTAEYSLMDAKATWDLYNYLQSRLASAPPQTKYLYRLEMAVLHPVLEMESSGVRIDVPLLKKIDSEFRRELDDLQGQAWRLARQRFNVRSNQDKQRLLYSPKKEGGQGLHGSRLVPSAEKKNPAHIDPIYDYSVDSASLHKWEGNPLVDVLISYSAKDKLHGTYVLPYLGGVPVRAEGEVAKPVESRLRNQRIYAQFKQYGTESGRFSSANPNLQNIPSRTVDGRRLREIFIPDPGHVLVVADYSQIEPRIVASLSGDKSMIATYRSGGDVYQMVSDRMGHERSVGKELVLSITYGVGPATIASRIGCTVAEARDLMDFFARRFSAIPAWKNEVILKARKNGYAETIMGRRRYLKFINVGDPDLRAGAERQAVNHWCQGSAADVMKIALVNIYSSLPDSARMLMTVHDEVVVQAVKGSEDEVIEIIRTEMEAARPGALSVPLVADVHAGINWKEAKG